MNTAIGIGTQPIESFAFIADQVSAHHAVDDIENMGGMWKAFFLHWRESDFRYLVMFADGERVRDANPNAIMATDNASLLEAIASAFRALGPSRCVWAVLLEGGSEGKRIAQDALFEHVVVRGHA